MDCYNNTVYHNIILSDYVNIEVLLPQNVQLCAIVFTTDCVTIRISTLFKKKLPLSSLWTGTGTLMNCHSIPVLLDFLLLWSSFLQYGQGRRRLERLARRRTEDLRNANSFPSSRRYHSWLDNFAFLHRHG